MAVLIFVGILVPLLAIEVAAYLKPGLIPLEIRNVFQNKQEQTLKGLKPDTELGYKYAPGLVNFPVPFEDDTGGQTYPVSTVSLGYDEVGFRDDGLKGPAYAVVIGDSYASCASVTMPECWVELLEQQSGKDLANLGVVGYGPQQEERMLVRYGLPLHPKLVVWVFFANDLNDAWKFDQFGSEAATTGKFWQNPVTTWLAQHSALYTLGAFFWYNRHLFYNLATTDTTAGPRDSNLVWWRTYTDLSVPEVAEGLALTQQSILQARQRLLAQDSTARFVVVILPYRELVYAPAALQPQLDQLNQALGDFCEQQNISCIDLTPALREKAQAENASIYYRHDIHLNRRGNQEVAEFLVKALKSYYP